MRLVLKSQWSILRSFIVACRASRALGNASRLARQQPHEALEVARQGISMLRAPGLIRDNPGISGALVGLTTLIESLAHELSQPGADLTDLRDALHVLENLG